MELRVDMFEPGSFPGVLQEIVIVSGRRIDTKSNSNSGNTCIEFIEHLGTNNRRYWSHLVPLSSQNWTKFLLTPLQLDVLDTVLGLPDIQSFGNVAKLEVSIVTGANDFFSINADELTSFQLQPWAKPLLPRIRHANGLIYTLEDHESTAAEGAKSWLLDFSAALPDPLKTGRPSWYLTMGETQGLNKRYKTSIRTPWYRVPSIWADKLMLSKRCHQFPRLVLNAANVVTTDTIYRGRMLPEYKGLELDLVAAFHNSLTLLTAEIEGRSFGGGVLELVPSEIARLAIPFPIPLRESFPALDKIARDGTLGMAPQNSLIEETDALICRHVDGLTADIMQQIQQARKTLVERRLSRN